MPKDSLNQSNKLSENQVLLTKQLAEQQSLVELHKSKGYLEYLRPFLFNLSQEGYPQPKDFDNNEALILAYTEKVGQTSAVKDIIEYVEGSAQRVADITKRLDEDNDFSVGS